MLAAEIRKKRVDAMRTHTHRQWHLDAVYVKINGQMDYLFCAVWREGTNKMAPTGESGEGLFYQEKIYLL